MVPILQAVSISGRIIQTAKWDVKTVENIREGQSLQINIEIEDQPLINYLSKNTMAREILDKDGKQYSVNLKMVVKEFKHMFEIESRDIQSMVLLVPNNRTVEQVLIYLLDRENIDPRFMTALKS